MYKYKIGEYVTTKGGEEAKIVNIAKSCHLYDTVSYKIEFPLLHTQTYWYPEYWLSSCKNPKDLECPVCNTKWTKTEVGMKSWRDCKPCGKREEDIK